MMGNVLSNYGHDYAHPFTLSMSEYEISLESMTVISCAQVPLGVLS